MSKIITSAPKYIDPYPPYLDRQRHTIACRNCKSKIQALVGLYDKVVESSKERVYVTDYYCRQCGYKEKKEWTETMFKLYYL